MELPKKLASEEKALTKRYLIWCYKTTKEKIDWIDRKFTQLEVDYFMLSKLEKQYSKEKSADRKKHLNEFKAYIKDKEKRSHGIKFVDNKKKTFTPEYFYLRNRLDAIEQSIVSFYSKKVLSAVKGMYEEEMTRRILQATGGD